MRTVRVGAGAGFSGDSIEPAVEVAEEGGVQYLVFECLAERTIALAQQARMKDPAQGYDPLLADRMRAVLGTCRTKGIKVITNMGAANPIAAAERTAAVARELGLRGLKIAAVTGDDVLDAVRAGDYALDETGETVASLRQRLSRRRSDRRGAGPGRRCYHYRPRRRPGDVPRATDPRVRLVAGGLDA